MGNLRSRPSHLTLPQTHLYIEDDSMAVARVSLHVRTAAYPDSGSQAFKCIIVTGAVTFQSASHKGIPTTLPQGAEALSANTLPEPLT